MKEIALSVFERQSLSVVLEGSLFELAFKECNGIMAGTVIRDGVTLVSNRRIVAGVPIIPEGHREEGNFIIFTDNDNLPYYSDFQVSNVLVYLTMEEVEAVHLLEVGNV